MLILFNGLYLIVFADTVEISSPPSPAVDAVSDAPSSESVDSSASSTDIGDADLSMEDKRRVSLIWSLLTNKSTTGVVADVIAEDSAKQIEELEGQLVKKEEEVNRLRDEGLSLVRQNKNLEMENASVRSQCGALKQENAALTRQYTNVKLTKDKEAGIITDSFAIPVKDILMFGKTLGSGDHASTLSYHLM